MIAVTMTTMFDTGPDGFPGVLEMGSADSTVTVARPLCVRDPADADVAFGLEEAPEVLESGADEESFAAGSELELAETSAPAVPLLVVVVDAALATLDGVLPARLEEMPSASLVLGSAAGDDTGVGDSGVVVGGSAVCSGCGSPTAVLRPPPIEDNMEPIGLPGLSLAPRSHMLWAVAIATTVSVAAISKMMGHFEFATRGPFAQEERKTHIWLLVSARDCGLTCGRQARASCAHDWRRERRRLHGSC
jgi:hypothetical protein